MSTAYRSVLTTAIKEKGYLFFLFLIIFFPILESGVKRYFLPEFILYFFIFFYLIFQNGLKIRLGRISLLLIKYSAFYFLMILGILLLKGNYSVSYIYQFRLVVMTTIWFVFLENTFTGNNYFTYLSKFRLTLVILFILPLITLASYLNGDIRTAVYNMYKPAIQIFDSVGYVFAGFREPGIFKDYYTATISYFSILVATSYYKFSTTKKNNTPYYLFLIVLLSAELVSGRTGFYFSILFLGTLMLKGETRKIHIFTLALGLPIIVYLITYLDLFSVETLSWVFEIYNNFGETNSTNDFSQSVTNFWSYLEKDYTALLIPIHPDNLNADQPFYSDSFYIQEIIRHGIWGLILNSYFLIALLRIAFKTKNFFLISLIIWCSIFNIKGGNVFFFERGGLIIWLLIFFLYKIPYNAKSINNFTRASLPT